ncbi:MAG: phage tail tip protein J-related protein [Aeromonas popoffii]|uniref:phage tail tip protein J-related protein n=1 Tax=Aeromonas popoffii TaxID=70856 RepID=UPI003F412BB1
MSVLSVAMSLMMKPKMPNQARGQAERKQVLRSSNAPVDWVYGHTIKSGLLAFAEEEVGGWQDEGTDPETNQGYVEWLHQVIILAGHPVDRIGRIWFNDDEIQTYGSKATYELLNNPQAASQFLLANCPSWKPDMILKGLASLRVSMLFDQQKYSAGIPNVKVEVWGRQIFDPRDNLTKWSDNAALVLLDFIRNHPKMRVPDDRIDWEAFKHAATICDEIVTDPKGKLEKRYTINGALDINERPASTMDDMLAAMSGELTWFGGLIGVQSGAYYGPATLTINSGDIISNIDITPESSSRERLNTVQGTFVDPEQGWVETDYPAVQVPEWLAEDGQEQSQDLKLRFVSSYYQAQRLANVVLRRNRLGQTLSFTMNLKGYAVMPGSYVRLKVPEIEMDREFRVVEWEHDPIGGTVKLTVREDGIAVWDDLIGKPINRPPLVNLPSGGPATPSDLKFQVETIGEVVQGLLTWRNSAMTAYTNINIKRGNVTIYTAQEPRNLHRLGGLPVGDYVAEMRAVGMTGGMSDKATIAFSVATPAAVTAVDIRAGNWDITLTPRLATTSTYGTEFEFFYYRTPLQASQVEATAQRLGYGAQLTHSGLQTGTKHYYWVRAINAYGKGPLYALEATTTRDVDSVLDVISGSIGADDLIEELRKPLEETIDMWTAKVGNTDIGKYGGIGLTIEQDPDGVWRTKCIVDADVFAILDPSGATGAGSRHPFIVKDGVVYMNKLLLDDAEIGSVIAKYINVQDLVAVKITASTIKSSDNGASFSLLPDGTMSCTKATIKGAITATSGSFTGTVNANAGTMNNVTIAENCNVLGTIYANRIVGDVYKSAVRAFDNIYQFPAIYGGSAETISIEYNRTTQSQVLTIYGLTMTLGVGNTNTAARLTLFIDGAEVWRREHSGGGSSTFGLSASFPTPAGSGRGRAWLTLTHLYGSSVSLSIERCNVIYMTEFRTSESLNVRP